VDVAALAATLAGATASGALTSSARVEAAHIHAASPPPSPPAVPPTTSTTTTPLPADVYLVGTGPGDPGLLTLAALQLMATASIVLVDRLVSPEILSLVNPAAVRVDVGKEAGLHTLAQPDIHAALIAAARRSGDDGSVPGPILRLKGGDPFIFGRGGEEAAALRSAGVAVHIVPGVTAAAGVCASLGIPATHRGLATSVRYLTGHALEGGGPGLDATVARAADPDTTLVVYMGLGTLPTLATRLMAGDESGGKGGGGKRGGSKSVVGAGGAGSPGLHPSTPAVAVERGTTPRQRAVFAPLSELAAAVGPEGAALTSPTLIVIGRVVALAPEWAEQRGERAWEGVAAGAGAGAAKAAGGVGLEVV
jgi:uroporphyrin-III C-methyltransferase